MKILLVSCGDVATEAGLRFIADGHRVTGWRRHSNQLPQSFQKQSVDLLDSSNWPRIDPDTELVVLTPVPVSRDVTSYQRSYLQVATELVTRLKTSCPQLKRLVYVSSTAVLGGDHGDWVTEQTPLAPARETSRVLAQTEAALLESGLPVTILRASGIYGPGRTRLIDQVREGTARIPNQSHWTNRIHRDDLAAAIVHVAALGEAAADVYVASDSQPAQLAEVYRFLADQLGLGTIEKTAEPATQRAADRRLDNSKLLASGLKLRFPSYREGYRSILTSGATRHR